MKTHVSNMQSHNGNKVPNQFIIETPDGLVFQSYNTVIAVKRITGNGVQVVLDRDKWDYSRTTGKYRNQFLGEKTADTQRKVKSGEYILEDLNA